MGNQIIKQPNGKYCIFSTIVDNITHYDMTPEEIIEEWTNDAKKKIEINVKLIICKLDNNQQPYFDSTKNYSEILQIIGEVHGDKEVKILKKLIET